ncbi:hypothetical protein BT69DRAFT_1329810 [Atractiella rhizophila]|nr:hypothetical protein BT69DRAFT_1329810 [Atractiella rhizophila]
MPPKSKSSRKRSSKSSKNTAETQSKEDERTLNDYRFGSPAFVAAAQETWKRHWHLKPSIFLLPEQGPPSLQTVFCLYPSAKEIVLKHTVQPITPPAKGWPFNIIPNRGPGGKGLMVATRDIAIGEVIIEERPLVIAPRIATMGDSEVVVSLLPEENRKLWDNLPNCKGPEVPKNQAIMRSNAVSRPLSDEEEKDIPCGAVFNQLSRMEHSCCPNTYTRNLEDSVINQVIANRFIPKGASITTSNVDILRPRSQRQSELERMWSIECHCEACDFKNIGELKASDQRRAFLSRKVSLDSVIDWCEQDTITQAKINLLIKEIKYAETEKVGFYPNIALSKIGLFFLYDAMGRLDKLIEVAESLLPTIKFFHFVVPEPLITRMQNTVTGVPFESTETKEEAVRKPDKKRKASDFRRMASNPNTKRYFFLPNGPIEPWMEDVMSGKVDDMPVGQVSMEQMFGYYLDSMGPDGRKNDEQFRKRMDEDPAFRQANMEKVRQMGILPEEYFKRHGKEVHLGMPSTE